MSELMDLFGEWGVQTDGTPKPLTVEPYLGVGATGAKYGAGISHPGLPQMPQSRLVRTSTGDEALSTTAVGVPNELAGDFPLHSHVRLLDGRVSTILSVSRAEILGLFDFVLVNLE